MRTVCTVGAPAAFPCELNVLLTKINIFELRQRLKNFRAPRFDPFAGAG